MLTASLLDLAQAGLVQQARQPAVREVDGVDSLGERRRRQLRHRRAVLLRAAGRPPLSGEARVGRDVARCGEMWRDVARC